MSKNKIVKENTKVDAHFEDGKLVFEQTTTCTGCTSCPMSEEHPVYTPDPFEHSTGVYCALLKDDNRYPGAETDRRKVFEYDYPSEKKEFKNFIPDWCPFREKEHTS